MFSYDIKKTVNFEALLKVIKKTGLSKKPCQTSKVELFAEMVNEF